MSAVKSFVFMALIAANATASVAFAAPQVEPLTVYAGEERTVYATVVDRKGAPVSTLGAEDFVVREGGIEREVLRAAPAAEPMRIAVLVDTSQAMQRYVNDLRTGLRAF